MSDSTPQPAGNPAPAEPAQPPAPPAATLTQEQFNAALADERRKWHKQQTEAAAEIKRKADEEARIKSGEFEAVANERAARLAQIEAEQATATEQLTRYQEAMERQIKARLKALPDEIGALDPGGDVLARFDWLTKAEAAAAKLVAQAAPRGTPPGPRGNGAAPVAGAADLIAQKKASGDYAL